MKKISLIIFGSMLLFSMKAQIKQTKLILKEEGKENAYPRFSSNGKQFLYQSNRTGKWQLFIYDIGSGQSKAVTSDSSNNNFPDWSKNNEWIAFVSDRSGNEEIYLMKKDASGLKQITNHPSRDIHPYFSPDGKYILFNSDRFGSLDIFRYTIATGKTERLTDTPQNETCARYSPDMKEIVYLKNDASADDVFILDMKTAISRNLTQTPGSTDGWPMFSPDGKWVYYSSMESGTYCIYRISPDGKTKEKLTSAMTGEEDARVCVSQDNAKVLFNKKVNKTIEVYMGNI